MDKKIALDKAFDYVDAIAERDMSRVDKINRSPERVRRLMRSYARNQASQATFETMAEDMRANEPKALDTDTIASYITALRKLFVVEESEAWNPNLPYPHPRPVRGFLLFIVPTPVFLSNPVHL